MGNTLVAANLHRILSDVRLFASTDSTLRAINAVRIETWRDSMVAVSTDRFVMGASRADYSGEEIAANISLPNIDNLLRIAKTTRKDSAHRRVEIVAVGAALEFNFSTGESLTVQTEQHDFPHWRQLLPKEAISGNEIADVSIGYNAAYLAKFSKVAGSREMQIISRSRRKPSIVRIGDDFIGLIMPVRLEEDAYIPPDWISY